MLNFVIQASTDHIDAFYDRYFNEPSQGSERYCAVGPLILLNFVETAEAASDQAPDSFLGAASYTEVGIWAPLLDLRRGRIALAVPYMFVDLGASMATGREVYVGDPCLARQPAGKAQGDRQLVGPVDLPTKVNRHIGVAVRAGMAGRARSEEVGKPHGGVGEGPGGRPLEAHNEISVHGAIVRRCCRHTGHCSRRQPMSQNIHS